MKALWIVIITFFYSSFAQCHSWDELAYLGKKYRAEGNLNKAIEYLLKAAETKPTDKYELYLYAGILSARVGNTDNAFNLLEKSIRSGMWDKARLERNSRLDELKQDKKWNELINTISKEENNYLNKTKITNPEIRTQLKQMWLNDQNLVGKKAQLKVIKANSKILNKIISDIGWPTQKKVGKDGEWLAWAIAQHSHDIQFQKRCLTYLQTLTLENKISPIYFAELTDRIARNSKVPQVYGMAIISKNGIKAFYPIFDVANVDKRREKIGLPPLKVWANENFVDISY